MVAFQGLDFLDVGAGHESELPSAGHDDRFDVRVAIGIVNRSPQLVQSSLVEGVCRRMIDRDDGYAVLHTDFEVLVVCHRDAPWYW